MNMNKILLPQIKVDGQVYNIGLYDNKRKSVYVTELQKWLDEKDVVIHTESTTIEKMNQLLEDCAEAYNVTTNDIKSSKRDHFIVLARNAFCYIARNMYKGNTYKYIGSFINRNHSTCLISIDTACNYIETEYYNFCIPFKSLKEKHIKIE